MDNDFTSDIGFIMKKQFLSPRVVYGDLEYTSFFRYFKTMKYYVDILSFEVYGLNMFKL